MAQLSKSSFYFGGFLYKLHMHNMSPTLIEKGTNSKVYAFTTNKGSYVIFAKYSASDQKKDGQAYLFNFTFSDEDIQMIEKQIADLKGKSITFLVALICVHFAEDNHPIDLDVALIDEEQFSLCSGLTGNFQASQRRIAVTYPKRARFLNVNGLGVDKPDAIQVSRKKMEQL
jgi:hypothetical protein